MNDPASPRYVRANAERLIALRQSAGLSRRRLAELAHISEGAVEHAEAGKRVLPHTIKSIAAALDYPHVLSLIDPEPTRRERAEILKLPPASDGTLHIKLSITIDIHAGGSQSESQLLALVDLLRQMLPDTANLEISPERLRDSRPRGRHGAGEEERWTERFCYVIFGVPDTPENRAALPALEGELEQFHIHVG